MVSKGNHPQMASIQVSEILQFTLYIYIKAGGSPEANCILFVWIWKMLILHCVLQCFMFFSESVRFSCHLHVHKGFLKQLLGARAPLVFCNVTTSSTKRHPQGFHNSQSNALHMTLLHPTPPPQPPFCKQQRYLQRNNIFNEATSSRFPQLSIQRTPHDVVTPPHHPSPYHNDVYGRGSRLRVSGSSGEPPALSLYIYILYTT